MARYLLESSATDGYLLEDGTGVLLLEGVAGIELAPDPVAVATAVPAPTLERTLTLTPAPIAASTTVPAPDVGTAITLSPAPIAIATTVPAPTTGGAEVTLTPLPVAVVATLPIPTVEVGAVPPEVPPEAGTGGAATITGSDRGAKGGTRTLNMTLFEHASGFYGCAPDEAWGDGATIVGWRADGDHPSGGFYPEPANGPVEIIPYKAPPAVCLHRGIRVTTASIIALDLKGWFGGVSGGIGTSITVQIRQNGTVISSQFEADPDPGLHFWGSSLSLNPTDILAAAGDEFEVSVVFTSWVGFEFFASNPGDLNDSTHFRVTGETLPGKPFLRAHVTIAASI